MRSAKIKGKPNVSEFLDGMNEKAAPKISKERRQKVVYLPAALLLDLKRAAFCETEASGSRVTETDIVERAITAYIYDRR